MVFERVDDSGREREQVKEDGYRVKNHRSTKLSSDGDELSDWLTTISDLYVVNR